MRDPIDSRRRSRRRGGGARALTALLVTAAMVLAATALHAHFKVEKMEPANGSTVDRPVRSLRIWFSQEPDVAISKLELRGPEGELQVTGIHTMGEKDLMGRVVGRMPDGEYTASWRSAGDDGHVQEGSWKFVLKRAGGRASAEP